jgi:hypothetical protein
MISSSLSHIFNKSVFYCRLWGWKLGLIFFLLHHMYVGRNKQTLLISSVDSVV